jgi:hypothetical protein
MLHLQAFIAKRKPIMQCLFFFFFCQEQIKKRKKAKKIIVTYSLKIEILQAYSLVPMQVRNIIIFGLYNIYQC